MDLKKAIVTYLVSEDEGERAAAKDELLKFLADTNRPPVTDAQVLIRKCLADLGCPEYLTGYPVLIRAIEMTVDDPTAANHITAGLYATLGREFDTTGVKAERNIRATIEAGWDRCDPKIAEQYFGNTISPSKAKPTNRQFIVHVANIVRRRMKEEI